MPTCDYPTNAVQHRVGRHHLTEGFKNYGKLGACGAISINASCFGMLRSAYHILKNNTPYKELGPDYFDQRRKAEIVKKSVKRLETFGFTVTIEQSANSSTA